MPHTKVLVGQVVFPVEELVDQRLAALLALAPSLAEPNAAHIERSRVDGAAASRPRAGLLEVGMADLRICHGLLKVASNATHLVCSQSSE